MNKTKIENIIGFGLVESKQKYEDTILHKIIRFENFDCSENNDSFTRTDVIDEDQFLQLSILEFELNVNTFKPHMHVWKTEHDFNHITQEAWVVIKGGVVVSYFDTDAKFICNKTLGPGDVSITLQGGHTYTITQPDTFVYEFKTGPYQGQKRDKVFI